MCYYIADIILIIFAISHNHQQYPSLNNYTAYVTLIFKIKVTNIKSLKTDKIFAVLSWNSAHMSITTGKSV